MSTPPVRPPNAVEGIRWARHRGRARGETGALTSNGDFGDRPLWTPALRRQHRRIAMAMADGPEAGDAPAAPGTWPVPAPVPVFLGGSREAEAQRMASAARELLELQQALRAVNA